MLNPLSPQDAVRLRRFFSEAGYTRDGIHQTLVITELAARHLRNLPRLLDRTREETTFHTLMRWFTVGVPVDIQVARKTTPEWVRGICLEGGLLLQEGETLVPTAMLTPFEHLLVATDHSLKIEAGKEPEIVLIINPTTWLLYRFTVRRPSRATLDLGAGCGVLALAAASHSERVVATDLSRRATRFARFNASLNGVGNVECLAGDAFEPVAGRTFDLIITNPPFYITPSSQHIFCENDMELDLFCRRLVREAPQHLNEGGYLQMLCEWAEIRGQPWQDRIIEWLDGAGCDAWIIKGNTVDPAKYAHDRMLETTPESPEADAVTYPAWMAHYRDRGVEAIHRGIIAMRRRSGRNWIRIEELSATSKEPFGEAILQGFAARDFLEAHSSDEQVLATKPKLSPHAKLDQRLHFTDGRWQLSSLHLFKANGLPYRQKVEPLVAEFLTLLDGSRTLGEAIRLLTAKVNANPEAVQRECLSLARRLIERSFLLV